MIKIEIKSVGELKSKIPSWLISVILISSLMITFLLYLRIFLLYLGAEDIKLRMDDHVSCSSESGDTRDKVRKAIINYINSTGDMRLTFDTGVSSQNVDTLLENLQKEFTYKGQKYGPFLDPIRNEEMPNYFEKTILGNDKAVRINIHTISSKVDILPDTKDCITYIYD